MDYLFIWRDGKAKLIIYHISSKDIGDRVFDIIIRHKSRLVM